MYMQVQHGVHVSAPRRLQCSAAIRAPTFEEKPGSVIEKELHDEATTSYVSVRFVT